MLPLLRVVAALAILGAWTCQAAAETRLDIPYGPAGAENTLDVQYQPGAPAPLIVFLHGGGWTQGDKKAGTRLLARFSPPYAYASVNYRLAPNASIKDAASDVGRAVAYLQKHAADYAIDPNRIVLMGHSAGAHLAALVALDPKYLAEAGASGGAIRGVVLLDCGGCDAEGDLARYRQMRTIFGSDPATWKTYSPVAMAGGTAQPPPFLITYAPDRKRSADNAQSLATALAARCQECQSKAYSKEHMAFLRDLADTENPMTKDIMDFLKARFGR